MIQKAYKYRIYPNKEQREFLDTCFNASRFIWNRVHESYSEMYRWGCKVNKKWIDKEVTALINEEDFRWCKTPPKRALEYVSRQYFEAWDKYFKGLKDGSIQKKKNRYIERKNLKGQPVIWSKVNDIGKPKFKSKFDKSSFSSDRGVKVDFDTFKVSLKGHHVKIVKDRIPDGTFKTVTFSKTKTGKYFISLTLTLNEDYKELVDIKNTVGVDIGVKDFATLSTGSVIENPRFTKQASNRLKRLQKRLSKQVKGSARWQRTKLAIAKLHEKTANKRSNFLHNVTHQLTRDFDGIGIEDLNVKGMLATVKGKKREEGEGFEQTGKKRKSGLARSVSDASFFEFRRQLEYKAKERGKHIIAIDRFAPSSKTCSNCNDVYKELKLSERTWTCEQCGEKHNRDINAAININKMAFNK